MKKIIVLILWLMFCGFVHGETKEVLDVQGKCVKWEITIELTPEEYKAMAIDCYSVEEWISNCIEEKARKMTDELVEKSGKGSRYTNIAEKERIIRELNIKTAKERTDEFEAKHKENLK